MADIRRRGDCGHAEGLYLIGNSLRPLGDKIIYRHAPGVVAGQRKRDRPPGPLACASDKCHLATQV
jgi:hypothetical protein